MRPPVKRGSVRTRQTLAPRVTRADATAKRIADIEDATRAYPTTLSGAALKNKSPMRFRDVSSEVKAAGAKKYQKNLTEVTTDALSSLVGCRVRVFWASENTHFRGKIVAFHPKTGKHVVAYDDGDEESLKLHREKFSWDGKNTPSVAAKIALAAEREKDPPNVSVEREKGVTLKGVTPTGVTKGVTNKIKSKSKSVSESFVKPPPKSLVSAGKTPGAIRAATAKALPAKKRKASVREEQVAPMETRVDLTDQTVPKTSLPAVDSNTAAQRPDFPSNEEPETKAAPNTPGQTVLPPHAKNAKHTGIVPGSKIAVVMAVAVPVLLAAGPKGLTSQTIMDALYAAGKGSALAGRAAPKIGVLAALDRGTAVGILRKLPVNGRTKRYQLAQFEPVVEDVLPPRLEKPPTGTAEKVAFAPLAAPAPTPASHQRDTPTVPIKPDIADRDPALSSTVTTQPHMRMSEDEAWACHSEFCWEPASPDAVRDAWVMCESHGCGKWRRVPSVVAARVASSGDAGWRCADSKDNRFARCDLPQELGSDDIDTRCALTNKAEAKRERKRQLDREYRVRRKARLGDERNAGGAVPDFTEEDDSDPPPGVCAILMVVGGDENRGARVVLALVYPAPVSWSGKRSAFARRLPARFAKLTGVASSLQKKGNGKAPRTAGASSRTFGGFATLQSLWAKAPPPRQKKIPTGLLFVLRKHCVFTVNDQVAVFGGAVCFGDAHAVSKADIGEICGRLRALFVEPCDGERLRNASPEPVMPNHTVHLSTPTIAAATPVPPGFALVPLEETLPSSNQSTADDGTNLLLAASETLNPLSAGEDMVPIGDIQHALLDVDDSVEHETTRVEDAVTQNGVWQTFGKRKARTRGDRLRARFKEHAAASLEAWRALPSQSAREEARRTVFESNEPSFLPTVPTVGSVPFWRVPQWTHPLWPLGGLGEPGPPRKKFRKLPRVWRGKDLDMIVFGRDERLEWARKTGMFLARARTALGDRRLHRNAWGGSVLDSVLGAMLTQNVSDVLSSSAIMNLAARFPGDGARVAPEWSAPKGEADVDPVLPGVLVARETSWTKVRAFSSPNPASQDCLPIQD